MVTFSTAREFAVPPEAVFAAFSDASRLARWWGPKDFRNTFSVCEFRSGGRWSFVMHGPDGTDYPNESLFEEVQPPQRVVLRHVNAPHFRLTVTVQATPTGSRLQWDQQFEDAAVARAIEPIVVPSNEQNLDRLAQELHRG